MFGFKRRHREVLAAVTSLRQSTAALLQHHKKELKMLTKDVQDLVDRVTKIQQIVPAVQEAFAGLSQQNKTIAAALAELQASGKASPEDLAALHQATNDLSQLTDQLGAAIPANTTESGALAADPKPDPALDPPLGDGSQDHV